MDKIWHEYDLESEQKTRNATNITHEFMVHTIQRVIASRVIRDGHVKYRQHVGEMLGAIRAHASQFHSTLLSDALHNVMNYRNSAANVFRNIHAEVQSDPRNSPWAPFWSAFIAECDGQLPPIVDFVALDAQERAEAERKHREHLARFPAVTDPFTLPQC